MKLSIGALVLGGSLALSATTQAQVDSVKLVNPGNITTGSGVNGIDGYAGGNYYVSPYVGLAGPTSQTLANDPTVSLNCVDFFHDVTQGETWIANVTNLGAAAAAGAGANADLHNTRLAVDSIANGSSGRAAGSDAAAGVNILQLYEEEAFLTTQYANDGGNAAEANAIQTAIWWVASGVAGDPEQGGSVYVQGDGGVDPFTELTNPSYDASNLNTSYWITYAENNAPTNASYYNQFSILSETGVTSTGQTSAQEYIVQTTSTPEPGTLALFATGLLMMVGVGATRSRRKASAGASFGFGSLA
jgi:hypothetical protein